MAEIANECLLLVERLEQQVEKRFQQLSNVRVELADRVIAIQSLLTDDLPENLMPSVSSRDVGLLVLRVAVGGTLVAHGTQKLFGWFGGAGLEKTGAGFESMGFTPGKANALAAGLGEAGGGALLALGLATPSAAGAVAGTMTVASSVHAPKGFFAQSGGLEYPAVLGVVASGLSLTGPGSLSFDAALGHRLNRPWMRTLALAAVPFAAISVIARRQQPPAAN